MESNKEESLRCIEIAISKFESGNYEVGYKFLKKSQALYPNEKAKELQQFYLNKQNSNNNNNSSSSNTNSNRNEATSSSSSSNSNSEENKPKYTHEQVEAIKKIKASKNFYEILEVSKTSTDVEIKKAYRKIALQLHPDKNHAPGAEEAFKMVTQAFSCLSDKQKRSNYDMHGSEDTAANRNPFQRGGGYYYDENLSPEDVFESFFGFPFGEGRHPGGNIRRRGGNGNFQFYSTGFSPFDGGFTFQQQRRRRTGQQAGQQGEEGSIFNLLLVFIPLILIFLSMLSGSGVTMEQKTQMFRLDPNTKLGFTNQRILDIKNNYDFKIIYYVKENFDVQLRNYQINLSQIEDVVVDQWLKQKRRFCVDKIRFEELLRNAKTKQNEVDIEKFKKELNDKKYEYCEELKSYFHL